MSEVAVLGLAVGELRRDARVVDGVPVRITERVGDGGRSFAVCRDDTGGDLTDDGHFDRFPTDEQIHALLGTHGWWSCPGCGRLIDDVLDGLIVDHVLDCDHVDDDGNPVHG